MAELGPGANIPATSFEAGQLTEMSIEPAGDDVVQQMTRVKIVFKISTVLKQRAAVTIRLPSGLRLAPPSTGIRVSSDGSTTASSAQVLEGNVIQIRNLVAPQAPDAMPGTKFTLFIHDIENQLSSRDAGDYEVTTHNYVVDGDTEGLYDVDSGEQETSYIAKPGKITPQGDLVISNPTNDVKLNTYNLKFKI